VGSVGGWRVAAVDQSLSWSVSIDDPDPVGFSRLEASESARRVVFGAFVVSRAGGDLARDCWWRVVAVDRVEVGEVSFHGVS